MVDLNQLQKKIIDFRDARDWKQFHNPKDVSLSLMLEAAELVEHFQWKTNEEIQQYLKDPKNSEEVEGELADVLYWILLLAHDLDVDLAQAGERKLQKTATKYPVEKSKGKHTKYSKL